VTSLAARWDWSDTDLGPPGEWPEPVRRTIDLVMGSPVPMCYMHGEHLSMVYNDAFSILLGDKHPGAFTRPASEVVSEVWDSPSVGPRFQAVLDAGEPFIEEGAELSLSRGRGEHGAEDIGFFLRAGSPVVDDDGAVLGVLHVVIETTAAVRRAQAVADLAAALAVAVTVDDVCKIVLRQAMTVLDALTVTVCLPSPGPARWRMARRHAIEELSPDEERLPLIWAELTPTMADVVARAWASGSPYLRENGELVVLPLRSGPAEAVILVERQPAPVPRDVVSMFASFGHLAGDALSRAVVYDTERTTAELLQRTLLPPSLPQSDDVSIAARYEPVSEGTVAGGDFYDSFFLPDGRLALVIGDVVGRGVMAATVMGQVRAATRGAALANSDPAVLLDALDRVVWDLDALWPASMPLGTTRARPGMAFGGELFVTMLFGMIDPDSGELQLASAGHCLPMLLRGLVARTGGAPRGQLVDMQVGPPLGIEGIRPVHRLKLEVGDILVSFTDGLLERRGEAFSDSEQRLVSLLDEIPPGSPRTVCQHIIDAMARDGGFEDDCAVLVAGRSPAGHRRASVVVPALPESVRAARDWAREVLTAWGVRDEDQYSVITGISELITNAVLHAGTESHLTLDLDSGLVAVTVADSGNRGQPQLTGADTMAVRGRGLSLVRAISDSFGTHRSSAGSTVWFEMAVNVVPQRAGWGG
jgi:anti-sigma regulatory factor (Ser/Thr protein kinase)